MKTSKRHIIFNSILLIVIILFIIPQTRVELQVLLHKGLSYINQSTLIDEDERKTITNLDWELASDFGNTLNFNDLEDRVVFINFWATWCPPCIAEMPSLQQLYNDYQDKVTFLFVTEDNLEKVEKFKSNNNFNFEVYNPLSSTPKTIRTGSIPRTFILNKKGEIVVDESGAIDWNSETVRDLIDQLLYQ